MKKVFFCFVILLVCSSSAGVWAQDEARVMAMATAQDKISLDIKGMDIVDVLKMLATKSNLNLVVDKNVAGRVTVFLKDVSPQEALRVILASNNLVQKADAGITRIMTGQDYEQLYGAKFYDQKEMRRVALKYAKPQDLLLVLNQIKSSIGMILADDATNSLILFDTAQKNEEMKKMAEAMDAPLKTQTFKLNYAKAETVASALGDVITKNIAQVKADSRTNQIIVIDYESKLNKVKEVVDSLDERTKEVRIDAKIIQVNLSDKTSLGIDWEYVLNKKLDIRGMFGQVISTTGNKWTIGTATPNEKNDYRAVIEALRTVGQTKILSSPRLTVTNNEAAKILVGSKQVYVTTSAVQSQTTTETAESVNFVDVGVKLFVTPVISHDGFISMKIRPEVSSVVQNYKTASGNIIPIVETSEAETTVMTEDGSTIIIGGLIKDEKVKSVNKIPILGDVPFLGALFRNTVDEVKKTELVIFLTCHILDFKKVEK
jgi:type II secretory pathway component GspD/PulD (secretin)